MVAEQRSGEDGQGATTQCKAATETSHKGGDMLALKDADGEHYAELTAGVSYGREIGVEHDVTNANDYEFVFVEVEMKPASS